MRRSGGWGEWRGRKWCHVSGGVTSPRVTFLSAVGRLACGVTTFADGRPRASNRHLSFPIQPLFLAWLRSIIRDGFLTAMLTRMTQLVAAFSCLITVVLQSCVDRLRNPCTYVQHELCIIVHMVCVCVCVFKYCITTLQYLKRTSALNLHNARVSYVDIRLFWHDNRLKPGQYQAEIDLQSLDTEIIAECRPTDVV